VHGTQRPDDATDRRRLVVPIRPTEKVARELRARAEVRDVAVIDAVVESERPEVCAAEARGLAQDRVEDRREVRR